MTLRCLIVDDSRDFLTSATTLLTLQGLQIVGQAEGAAEAVALAGSTSPDVVLVDVELGPHDGVELAMRLATNGLAGRVILISVRDRSEIRVPAPSTGVVGFVRKDALDAITITDLLSEAPPSAPSVRGDDSPDLLAAFRRLAGVVAQGADPHTVFRRVAHEASLVLRIEAVSVLQYHPETRTVTKLYSTHGDRSAVANGSTWPIEAAPEVMAVIEAGGPVRVDTWESASGVPAERHRALGFGGSIAAPIVVDGAIWGQLAAYGLAGETLPPGCEQVLADFTNLVATSIANVQARVLADSQSALRRVATLVAQGAEPQRVFTTVAEEASRLLNVNAVSLIRYDAATATLTKLYGTHGRRSPVPDGTVWPLADSPESVIVVRTGGPARVDDWDSIPGPAAAGHRAEGFGGCVGVPIMVEGAIWGILAAYGEADQILPPNCEHDLADFTNLMASAIANAEAREELRRLAERQGAALRRVATLVAQRASSETIFDAVALEAQRALRVARVDVCRCHSDGTVALVGSTARRDEPDNNLGGSIVDRIAKEVSGTAVTARFDELRDPDHLSSAVGTPVQVDGEIWGVIVILDEVRLADDIETRLADFAHLVASSIANVAARDNLIASRARVVSASDDTRRSIERNLHDGVQQRVVALALSLRALRTRFSLPPEAQCGLDEIARGLDGVLEEVRVFSQGLHPALLSRSGLHPALRELVRRSPIVVDLTVCAQRFTEPIETAVYYVVSEALSNAVKHSHASAVSVVIDADDLTVRATVADNGAGGAVLGRGSGLIGLFDRVEAAGGHMSLTSPIGLGTTITIEIPLGPAHEHREA